MTVGARLELVPFQNKECKDGRLDMSSSDVEPNLVHFHSDTRLDLPLLLLDNRLRSTLISDAKIVV